MESESLPIPDPPPWSLRIAAQLCAFAGGLAIVENVARWQSRGIYFKFDVLLIPVAFCLLRRGRRAWWTAVIPLVTVTTVGAYLAATDLIQNGPESWRPKMAAMHWSEQGYITLSITLFLLTPLLLLSARTRRWIKDPCAPARGHGSWLAVPLAAGILTAMAVEAGEQGRRETADAFFHFNTKLTVLEDATGLPVDAFSWTTGPRQIGSSNHQAIYLEPSIGSRSGPGNFWLEGLSGRPFTIIVGADGMLSEAVSINKQTSSSLVVRLKTAPPEVYEATIDNGCKPGLGFRLSRWWNRLEISCFLTDPESPDDFSRGFAVSSTLENDSLVRPVFRVDYGSEQSVLYSLQLPEHLTDEFTGVVGTEGGSVEERQRSELKFRKRSHTHFSPAK